MLWVDKSRTRAYLLRSEKKDLQEWKFRVTRAWKRGLILWMDRTIISGGGHLSIIIQLVLPSPRQHSDDSMALPLFFSPIFSTVLLAGKRADSGQDWNTKLFWKVGKAFSVGFLSSFSVVQCLWFSNTAPTLKEETLHLNAHCWCQFSTFFLHLYKVDKDKNKDRK